jgi:hypothetical protein
MTSGATGALSSAAYVPTYGAQRLVAESAA